MGDTVVYDILGHIKTGNQQNTKCQPAAGLIIRLLGEVHIQN